MRDVGTSMNRRFLLVGSAVLVITGSLFGVAVNAGAIGGSANGGVISGTYTGPGSISHFTCYKPKASTAQSGFNVSPVILANQFAPNGFSAALGTVTYHCNPVQKTVGTATNQTVTPIVNPVAHLLCFSILKAPTQPTYNVQVTNQFGIADMTTSKPTSLCVPSWKEEGTPANPITTCSGCVSLPQAQVQPPEPDHYVCYTATYTKAAGAVLPTFTLPSALQLQDEFMTSPASAALKPPNLVCVPTEKTVVPGIAPTPLANPRAHLVCFPVAAKGVTPVPVTDQNQFGLGSVSDLALSELCVPSYKEIITTSGPTPTTGTVVLTAVDPATGIGLVGATFQASDGSGAPVGTCTTDLTGRCSIGGLTPGSFSVVQTGAPDGYEPASSSQTVDVNGENNATLSFFDVFTE
ncbi:MAG: prealbumin-like fold domain-containing protein [Acidimicrobiales bacterium]|jgi:hypothetical protein